MTAGIADRALTTREAIGLLFDRAAVGLGLVVLLGWWMTETGGAASAVVASPELLGVLSDWIGTLTVVVGSICYYGGGLALGGKVVHDAVVLALARSR